MDETNLQACFENLGLGLENVWDISPDKIAGSMAWLEKWLETYDTVNTSLAPTRVHGPKERSRLNRDNRILTAYFKNWDEFCHWEIKRLVGLCYKLTYKQAEILENPIPGQLAYIKQKYEGTATLTRQGAKRLAKLAKEIGQTTPAEAFCNMMEKHLAEEEKKSQGSVEAEARANIRSHSPQNSAPTSPTTQEGSSNHHLPDASIPSITRSEAEYGLSDTAHNQTQVSPLQPSKQDVHARAYTSIYPPTTPNPSGIGPMNAQPPSVELPVIQNRHPFRYPDSAAQGSAMRRGLGYLQTWYPDLVRDYSPIVNAMFEQFPDLLQHPALIPQRIQSLQTYFELAQQYPGLPSALQPVSSVQPHGLAPVPGQDQMLNHIDERCLKKQRVSNTGREITGIDPSSDSQHLVLQPTQKNLFQNSQRCPQTEGSPPWHEAIYNPQSNGPYYKSTVLFQDSPPWDEAIYDPQSNGPY